MTNLTFDTHTLYIKNWDSLTEDDVVKMVNDVLVGTRFEKRFFKVAQIISAFNGPKDSGHLFVCEELYNLFLGKNADGSEIVDFIPPVFDTCPYDPAANWRWADYAEAYDDFQLSIAELGKNRRDAAKQLSKFKLGNIIITRSGVEPVKSQYLHNVLSVKAVPMNVTKKMIYDIVSPYVVDKTTVDREIILNGKVYTGTYPYVVEVVDGTRKHFFIIFNPNTAEAQFTLCMMKRALYTPENKKFFGHAFKQDGNFPKDNSHKDNVRGNIPLKRGSIHSQRGSIHTQRGNIHTQRGRSFTKQ